MNLAVRGVLVMLEWVTYTGGTVDPGTNAIVGGVTTPMTGGPYSAFMHQMEAKSALRQFVEIEAGDIVIDLPRAAPIDGLQNLRFLVNGNKYEQKELGGRLSMAWDVVIAGNRTVRTVLLKLAT